MLKFLLSLLFLCALTNELPKRPTPPKLKKVMITNYYTSQQKEVTTCNKEGLPIKKYEYEAGQPRYITTFTYNEKNQLQKSVENNDGAWDYIQEFGYDSKGNLNFLLWGQNRYGFWESEQMLYNQYNHVIRHDYHAKNGDLKYAIKTNYTYDDNNNMIAEKSIKYSPEEDEETFYEHKTYTYNNQNNQTTITSLDENEKIIFKYEFEYNSQHLKSKEIYYKGDALTRKESFNYNNYGELIERTTIENGITTTLKLQYNSYGQPKTRLTTSSNGKKYGIKYQYYYWK